MTAGQPAGRIVIRAYDDSPCPLTGRVTGQLDEDRLEVAWADEQYSSDPRVTLEWLDELTPFHSRAAEAEAGAGEPEPQAEAEP